MHLRRSPHRPCRTGFVAGRRPQLNDVAQLELPTNAFGTADLPGLELEDGNRVNNNALLWKPRRRVSDYLDIAGVDTDADFDNLFIVRADGTSTVAAVAGSATSKRWK